MKQQAFDLVIVGVGGQGTLLASKILGKLAMMERCGVKVSEVHGMSQRGGSVITHVRVAEEVFAPMVAEGHADFVLSFEALEAARAASFLKKEGIAIVNTQQILPMPVITGALSYPQNVLDVFEGHQLESTDALALAMEAGNAKALNLVLLGMLSKHLWFEETSWEKAITACVPPKTLAVNLKAFQLGRQLVA